MSANEQEIQQDVKETQRLEAFSDGVFAIAITLLVLEIRLPGSEGEEGGLLAQLLEIWPAYLAYLISFLTIGIMWANHDALLRDIRRSDRAFMLLNAVLLMMITFVNFPTVVLAEHLQEADANVAAMFYSGTLFVIAILYNGLWWYAVSHKHLFGSAADPRHQERITRQYIYGPLLYFVAVVAAAFSSLLSLAICLALAMYFALTGRRE